MKKFRKSLRKHGLFIGIVFLIGLAGWIYYSTKAPGVGIKSYEECVAVGNPVMESFPPQCRTQDGRVFVQPVSVPSASPKKVKIKGKIGCLPAKGSGPHTMECAFGLQAEDGKYYGLGYTDPNGINMSAMPTGEVVVVEGTLRDQPESKYDIVGIIDVSSMQK